jgi:UDP-N-acetylmuramoyl-L-alanyl-D-glutamate--2,6-diaminopimelate ligase
MKLKELITALDQFQCSGDRDTDIAAIVTHSGKAFSESLFVALPGTKTDGSAWLDEACSSGARVCVTEKPYERPGILNILVPDARIALGRLAARFYGEPTRRMQLAGITGTNGKTTSAYLLEAVFRAAGRTTGLVSTVAYRWGSTTIAAERTTPDQLELQRIFAQMAAAGVDAAVMEVSSHGLQQGRVGQCHFDAALFTNLTPEHLDYHLTMEDYFCSKKKLFTELLPASCKQHKTAVINIDDPRGAELLKLTPCRALTFGLSQGDVHATASTVTLEGITAEIATPAGSLEVSSALIGRYNLANILGAVAMASAMGIPAGAIAAGIAAMAGAPGRMERIRNSRGLQVFVDYAHTGDALENVLQTLQAAGAGRIITVFGCGGDRDREKRPVMGSVAARLSRLVILTSDNPRSEEPGAIISQIEQGIAALGLARCDAALPHDRGYCVIPDRRTAIEKALSIARAGDVVLIAGKGHEDYQQIGSTKLHFDDREEARRILGARA